MSRRRESYELRDEMIARGEEVSKIAQETGYSEATIRHRASTLRKSGADVPYVRCGWTREGAERRAQLVRRGLLSGETREKIAEKTGISVATVARVVRELRAVDPVVALLPRHRGETVLELSPKTLETLRGPASRRGVSPSALVAMLVVVLSREPSLIDAILDDGR